jgi:sterol desaturase/sphingolipid hydroxylase (fatty acid hydroxylase superfamily)
MTVAWWQAAGASLLPYFIIAIAAHLMMSLGQTLFHRYLGHHRLGGRFFKNHIGFHHTDYADNHLVSNRRPSLNGNNTPFFLIPSILVIGISYWAMPFDFLIVQITIMSLSFGAHVYLDRQYHVEESWLQRYNWFIQKQRLHFSHHQDGAHNYAVIDSFWDRLLGTYKKMG